MVVTVKQLLVYPLIWLLSVSDVLATVLPLVGVGGIAYSVLDGLGAGVVACNLVALLVGIPAGALVGLAWVDDRGQVQSPFDMALEMADRLANWAGYDSTPADQS
ncbi:hypothetical protein [Streptomyces sp. NPDC055607]